MKSGNFTTFFQQYWQRLPCEQSPILKVEKPRKGLFPGFSCQVTASGHPTQPRSRDIHVIGGKTRTGVISWSVRTHSCTWYFEQQQQKSLYAFSYYPILRGFWNERCQSITQYSVLITLRYISWFQLCNAPWAWPVAWLMQLTWRALLQSTASSQLLRGLNQSYTEIHRSWL